LKKTKHPRRARHVAYLAHRAAALVVFVFLSGGAVLAQSVLTFSADRTESVFAENRERILLRGDARVRSDDFEIQAETIEIFGEGQRYLRSTGGVTVYDAKNDLFLTSEEFFLDRESNFLRASGDAYMEDRPNELVVKGGTIQNWDEYDLTEISVNVRILGEDYTARGQFARYRRGSETLELSGTPEVFWKGDEYRAARIRIDLANDEIEFVGDVRAVVQQPEDDAEPGEADAAGEADEPGESDAAGADEGSPPAGDAGGDARDE